MAILLSLFSVAILLTHVVQLAWRHIAFLKMSAVLFLLLVAGIWAADSIYKPYPLYSFWGKWNCTLSGQTDCVGFSSPEKVTQIKFEHLSNTLQLYEHNCGQFPKTQMGLEAMMHSRSICQSREMPAQLKEADLLDGWGYPIQYISDGMTYKLRSLGSDGQAGGEGDEVDILWSGGNETQQGNAEVSFSE